MHLSLVKLQSFISVGENLSFRIASEKLNLSQPAVSAHVRDLEESLGVPLLSRTTRSVKITPEGANFLIRAKRALDELEDVVLDLKEQAALRRGRISIGCVPSIAYSVLPVVLSRFSEKYPDIRIRVFDEMADRLYERVLNSEVDLMVGPISPQRNELEFQLLFNDQYVAVVPHQHALAAKKTVTIRDIAKYPLLLLTSPTNVQIVLEKAFEDAQQLFNPVYEARNPGTIGGMIEEGLGITALPKMTMPTIMRPELKVVPIAKPSIVRKIGLLTRRGESSSPAAVEFSKTVREVVEADFGTRIS
jgi:LysR family transcriptional regulator, carnitine catabolism transcriptional activator